MGREREIKEAIRSIAGIKPVIIFSAVVKSVSGKTCTVTHGKLDLTDVRLTAIDDNSTNVILVKPTVGSIVLVADESNGEMRDLCVFKYSKIDDITINGGNLGGLIKIGELISQLGKLTARVDGIISAINSGVPAAGAADGGAALQTTIKAALQTIVDKEDFSNIEDVKIKH